VADEAGFFGHVLGLVEVEERAFFGERMEDELDAVGRHEHVLECGAAGGGDEPAEVGVVGAGQLLDVVGHDAAAEQLVVERRGVVIDGLVAAERVGVVVVIDVLLA